MGLDVVMEIIASTAHFLFAYAVLLDRFWIAQYSAFGFLPGALTEFHRLNPVLPRDSRGATYAALQIAVTLTRSCCKPKEIVAWPVIRSAFY